jgi:hypothetical protein
MASSNLTPSDLAYQRRYPLAKLPDAAQNGKKARSDCTCKSTQSYHLEHFFHSCAT